MDDGHFVRVRFHFVHDRFGIISEIWMSPYETLNDLKRAITQLPVHRNQHYTVDNVTLFLESRHPTTEEQNTGPISSLDLTDNDVLQVQLRTGPDGMFHDGPTELADQFDQRMYRDTSPPVSHPGANKENMRPRAQRRTETEPWQPRATGRALRRLRGIRFT